jgi:hypothetical protein
MGNSFNEKRKWKTLKHLKNISFCSSQRFFNWEKANENPPKHGYLVFPSFSDYHCDLFLDLVLDPRNVYEELGNGIWNERNGNENETDLENVVCCCDCHVHYDHCLLDLGRFDHSLLGLLDHHHDRDFRCDHDSKKKKKREGIINKIRMK